MMEIRNPEWTGDGRIDCEVNHPVYGWIPFTADEEDPEKDGRAVFAVAAKLDPAPYVPPVVDEGAAQAAARSEMSVSRLQAKAALYHAGMLTKVEQAMAKADFLTQLAWTEAAEFHRTSPTILALAQALEISDETLDALFAAGREIEF